jgi:hypothetical protein
MSVIEFSIIGQDRVGELARLIAPLAKANINIRGLEVVDRHDHSEFRFIVDDVARAKQAFTESEIAFATIEVIAVEIENTPGELHRMAKALADANISIMYTYPLLDRTPLSVAVLRVADQDIDNAIRVLEKEGFSFIVEH